MNNHLLLHFVFPLTLPNFDFGSSVDEELTEATLAGRFVLNKHSSFEVNIEVCVFCLLSFDALPGLLCDDDLVQPRCTFRSAGNSARKHTIFLNDGSDAFALALVTTRWSVVGFRFFFSRASSICTFVPFNIEPLYFFFILSASGRGSST
jgi:hypothetical protein